MVDRAIHGDLADEPGEADLALTALDETERIEEHQPIRPTSGEDGTVVVADGTVRRTRPDEQEARWAQLFVLLLGKESF